MPSLVPAAEPPRGARVKIYLRSGALIDVDDVNRIDVVDLTAAFRDGDKVVALIHRNLREPLRGVQEIRVQVPRIEAIEVWWPAT